MKYKSTVEERGSVRFPGFAGEQHYMISFLQDHGLPDELVHWQPTVDDMLDGIKAPGPIYLMIDQQHVRQGEFHRRPGVHIDGYWNPAMQAHGYGGSHGYSPPSHSFNISHVPLAEIENIWGPPKSEKKKTPVKPRPEPPAPPPTYPVSRVKRRRRLFMGGWQLAKFDAPEAIILASDVTSARSYLGEFDGPINEGGSCEHVLLEGLVPIPLQAGKVYAGNVTMLHESLPVQQDCFRTVVRLNVPGWEPGERHHEQRPYTS